MKVNEIITEDVKTHEFVEFTDIHGNILEGFDGPAFFSEELQSDGGVPATTQFKAWLMHKFGITSTTGMYHGAIGAAVITAGLCFAMRRKGTSTGGRCKQALVTLKNVGKAQGIVKLKAAQGVTTTFADEYGKINQARIRLRVANGEALKGDLDKVKKWDDEIAAEAKEKADKAAGIAKEVDTAHTDALDDAADRAAQEAADEELRDKILHPEKYPAVPK